MRESNEDSQVNSMTISDLSELKKAIQRQLECDSFFRGAVGIREQFLSDCQVWKGTVSIFDLLNHPTGSRCYAWSSQVEGTEQMEYVAILHSGPVDSPRTAVRAHVLGSTGHPESQ